MKKTLWRKIHRAVKQGDVAALRTMADDVRDEEGQKLLLLFADMVRSALPTGGAGSRKLPRIAAKKVYDSMRQPQPAGMRAAQGSGRQALYQAGPYAVDLRLEPGRGSGRVCLVGQIADRRQPERGLGDVPVLLMSGKDVVARAFSNVFGEFQMEYQLAPQLRLCFPVEHKVDIRLSELMSLSDAAEG